MISLVCDMCKQPMSSTSDIYQEQGYRFKGTFVYIRSQHAFGKKKEVEEAGPVYDICQGCYNKLRNLCEEVNE